jgi:hypothetical protein
MSELSKVITEHLRSLGPDGARKYLNRIQADIAEEKEIAAAEANSEQDLYRSWSVDELSAELEGYNPRNYDPNKQRMIRTALNEKLQSAEVERSTKTMPQADFRLLQAQREKATQDLQTELGKKIVNHAKVRELKKNLDTIMQNPDLKAVPVAPPPETND